MASTITQPKQIQSGSMPLATTTTVTDASSGWYISDVITVTFSEPFGEPPSVVMQTNGGNIARLYDYRLSTVNKNGFSFWLVANAPNYTPNRGQWIAVEGG